MTEQNTNRLKFEIKRFVDDIGMGFLKCSWLDKLSNEAKETLREYLYDAKTLSRRDIAIMLYKDQDDKLWDIIMGR